MNNETETTVPESIFDLTKLVFEARQDAEAGEPMNAVD